LIPGKFAAFSALGAEQELAREYFFGETDGAQAWDRTTDIAIFQAHIS
jgi:hypothetical protein